MRSRKPMAALRRIALALVLVTVAALPAAAQELLMVTGVGAHDVLNLRAAPSAASQILDRIPPDAIGLRTTGATEQTGSTLWREVVWRGTTGWVAGRYVTPERLSCAGTEPFWSLSLAGGAAIFGTPQGGELRFTAGERRPAEGRWWPQAMRLHRGGGAGLALMDRRQCSDGMSDLDYPYAMTLMLPSGMLLEGCCRLVR